LGFVQLFREYFVETDGGHQRDGETGDHQDHGDGPEFVVAREIVQEKAGEWHEITSPRQGNGEDSSRYDPGPYCSFGQEQREDEKKQYDGSDIYRSRCSRLCSPVAWKLFDNGVRIGNIVAAQKFCSGRFLAEIDHRGSPFEIGDQQRHRFIYAITPAGGVILVEPGGFVPLVLGQFRRTPDRKLPIFVGCPELFGIGGNGQQGKEENHRASFQEVADRLLLHGKIEFCHPENQDGEHGIVGDLQVVGIDLKCQEYREESTAGPEVFLPGMVECANHGCHVTNGYRLGIVTCGNNDKVVGGESEGDGADQTDPWI